MADTARVWIIDDDPSTRWVLERALARSGLVPESFGDGDAALRVATEARPDAVIVDVRMPGTDGLTVAERLHRLDPALPVVVMTAHSDLDTTVAAFEGGAFEYLPKPFDLDEVVDVVRRALESGSGDGAETEASSAGAATVLGQAPAMQELFRTIGRLARAPVTVLITGESGTGKELVAQALHRHSPRAHGPFVGLNTAAIPSELLESELFGHERGAFTGADSRRQGRFEQAHGGTLFLDEIGDMPAELQTRLLRVLSEGRFYRVGGNHPVSVDVRILAATHQDLEARVAAGDFRADLYHRLNVVRVPVPPLRERTSDIPLLADHFLAQAARELGIERKRLAPAVERRLERLDWPGNVRELENLCRWLTVMAAGHTVHPGDLPTELRGDPADEQGPAWERAVAAWAEHAFAEGQQNIAAAAQRRLERTLIEQALRRTGDRRGEAAALLGWGRNTLTRKIQSLGIGKAAEASARED
jgi:two-component system nitrogen regulation response regulator GlnG